MLLPTPAEKDAAPACMYIAALYQRLHQEGRTLLDYYYSILEELGSFDVVNRSIMMVGAEGMLRIERIMASLRKGKPETFGGETVRNVVDYWDTAKFGPLKSESDKLPRNVVVIDTDNTTFTVRPSGTEPKLKIYCQLRGVRHSGKLSGAQLQNEAREKADRLARHAYNDLLGRIDLSLDEAALLLPDIIDFNRKEDFQKRVVPALRDAMASGRFRSRDAILDWLRGEIQGMLPGDPLPAVKAAVGHLCTEWQRAPGAKPVLAELSAWATS
jgi:hypothetical protein